MIHSTAQNENVEDSTMLECLSEASLFLNTIPKELQDRQNYLDTNKSYRLEYEQYKKQFTLWLTEAKQKLKSAEDGKNDYKNIVSNLENIKVSLILLSYIIHPKFSTSSDLCHCVLTTFPINTIRAISLISYCLVLCLISLHNIPNL